MGKIRKGSTIRSQTMLVVSNVKHCFDEEKLTGNPKFPYSQVLQRVSSATGIGLRRVKAICSEEEKASAAGKPFPSGTPGKKRPRASPVSSPDSFDLAAIRRKIHNFYLQGELPTLQKLCATLRVSENPNELALFSGSKESLRILLTKHLGFKFKKVNRRKFLLERTDVVALRHEFLRQIKTVEFENAIFLDETWVNENHCVSKCWQSEECGGVQVPIGKGKRLILLHAGGSKGFVENGLLLFQSKSGKADYHEDMNSACFTQWFKTQLLPNIPPHSVIVMDNAPYHSVQLDKAPVSNSLKKEMQDWLVRNEIPFDDSMIKAQLYELIKLHKPRRKTYAIDEMALAAPYFNRVIRLPPYHCQFNPIEMIWAQVKNYVAKKNKTFRMSDVEKLTREAVTSISAESWQKHVQHVKNDIEDYWIKDGLIETAIEPLIISFGQDSSSDSDTCDEHDSTDSDTEIEDFNASFQPLE